MLVFRDHPNQCIGLFDTDEIDIAIKCICTAWFFVSLSVCYSFILILYPVYDFDNNINNIIIIVVAMCELRCRKSEGVGYAEGYPLHTGGEVLKWNISGILTIRPTDNCEQRAMSGDES